MQFYLIGQRSFAAAVLARLLADGHECVGITAPPGDGLHLVAEQQGLASYQGGVLPTVVPDVLIACHWHQFIGAADRAKARLGCLGYHPSLLPLHRGRDAVRWVVHMRERVTGGTVYWMDDGADTGPVAAQRHCFVRPGDDASSLWRRELFPLGVALLAEVAQAVDQGQVQRVPQDQVVATFEPAWTAVRLAG